MAMNKAEKAALEAAQDEARLRELFVLLPLIPPDIPAPGRANGHASAEGWLASCHRSYSITVGKVRSTVSCHDNLTADGRKMGSGRQGAVALYSTKELAVEAAKRAHLWDFATGFLAKVKSYERNN
jgi:hypothetical protein